MHDDPGRVRSIASRASWAQRRRNALFRRRSQPSGNRRLAPRNSRSESSQLGQPGDEAEQLPEDHPQPRNIPLRTSQTSLHEQLQPLSLESSQSGQKPSGLLSASAPDLLSLGAKRKREDEGVPGQIVKGIRHALSLAKVDPFDTLPITLTAKDQGLLHHCKPPPPASFINVQYRKVSQLITDHCIRVGLSIYATMMFDTADQGFNPLREVWVPIDFSNAAAFHGMLAHSAAHQAALRDENGSSAAIEHKLEALRLVNTWLQDPLLAISDDAFSAVWRLLTFEVGLAFRPHLLRLR